jgi:hypothetical protein
VYYLHDFTVVNFINCSSVFNLFGLSIGSCCMHAACGIEPVALCCVIQSSAFIFALLSFI